MTLVLALILAPFCVGAGLLCLRLDGLRKILVAGAVLAVCALCITLAMSSDSVVLNDLPVSAHAINLGMLLVEIAMGLYLVYVGVRAKNVLIVLIMTKAA